jgi:uncharacterized spore protein YtfJ
MNNLTEVLGKVTDFLKNEAKIESIIGQQFKLGEFTCVPVMSIGIGFGGGEGKGNAKATGEGEGSGAGAGVGMGPVGFLVSQGSDIQFIPTRGSKGLNAVFEKLPDLLEKYLDKKETQKA